MGKQLVDRIPFARIATMLAVILGVSFGMCGIATIASNGGNREGFLGTIFRLWIYLGAAGFWLSLLGLICTFISYVVLSIAARVAFDGKGPQRLFGDSQDSDDENKSK